MAASKCRVQNFGARTFGAGRLGAIFYLKSDIVEVVAELLQKS